MGGKDIDAGRIEGAAGKDRQGCARYRAREIFGALTARELPQVLKGISCWIRFFKLVFILSFSHSQRKEKSYICTANHVSMKNTALTQKHISLGAKMVPFAGYNMPVSYSGLNDEHLTVRNAVGVFDVSHMGEFILKGDKA